jgi:hypothetical protein
MIGCAVVLYSLFRRSTKWCLENLQSVQFFFAPARKFNVRFGKKQNTVLNGQRITPESLGNISDIIGDNELVLRAHVPGHKGDGCKKNKKHLSLKLFGHETLAEFIYFLGKQKKYPR